MKKINFGQSDRLEFTGQALRGLLLNVNVIGSTDNTALVPLTLDFDQIKIDVFLNQFGGRKTIVSGTMGVLAQESNFNNATYKHSYLGKSGIVMRAEAVAAKPWHLFPLAIDFGGIIVLKGDEMLTAEINISSSVTGVEATTKASYVDSYVDVEGIEGIGTQYFTPSIMVYSINAAEAMFKKSLGNNVTGISFINKDKSDELDASAIISAARIYSDRLNVSKDITRLIAERYRSFGDPTQAALRAQSFDLLDEEIDACNLELSLVAANVVASKNHVVVRSFDTSKREVGRARGMDRKHIEHAQKKIK